LLQEDEGVIRKRMYFFITALLEPSTDKNSWIIHAIGALARSFREYGGQILEAAAHVSPRISQGDAETSALLNMKKTVERS